MRERLCEHLLPMGVYCSECEREQETLRFGGAHFEPGHIAEILIIEEMPFRANPKRRRIWVHVEKKDSDYGYGYLYGLATGAQRAHPIQFKLASVISSIGPHDDKADFALSIRGAAKRWMSQHPVKAHAA